MQPDRFPMNFYNVFESFNFYSMLYSMSYTKRAFAGNERQKRICVNAVLDSDGYVSQQLCSSL